MIRMAAIALFLMHAPPAAAQTPIPAPVKDRINEMVATCFKAGGTLGDQRGPNSFSIPRDFDGDGRTDFLVAEGGFPCAGRPTLFRPDGMARLQLWLADGSGGARLVFDQRVSGHRLIEGRPAGLAIARLGAACGVGIARCEDRIQLAGAAVTLVPADGRRAQSVTLAAPAARPAAAPPAAAPAAAAAAAAGKLPLRPGYYVASDEPCNRAANATVLLFTGNGINGSRDICTFRKVEQTGPARYRVTQSCQALGGWGRETPAEIATVIYDIPDDRSLTIRWSETSSRTARFCPQASMNEPFRSNDIGDIIR